MATDDAILDILGPPPGDVAATIPTRVLETILIRFLARVVHADGTIHPKELSSLVDIAIKLQLGGDEARRILPPAFRTIAKIVQLNYFTVDEIEDILREHEAKGGAA